MNYADSSVLADATVCLQSVHKVFPSRIGVMKWFDRSKPITALHDINLRAARGEVVVLMGPNGSGKSTLLKLIAASLLPDRGQVVVFGFDTSSRNLEARRAVGFAVAQERSFYPRLTADENLSFFASLDNVPRNLRRERIGWALEQCGLGGLGHRFVHQFSSGMYQRLAIARALLKQPAVLLLDEPSRSADLETATTLRQLVRTLALGGTTILLATHNFEEAASLADSIVLLSQGMIATRLPAVDSGLLRSAYESLSPASDSEVETLCEVCLP
jgi:ABC-2 type transport system ATP-binding protein